MLTGFPKRVVGWKRKKHRFSSEHHPIICWAGPSRRYPQWTTAKTDLACGLNFGSPKIRVGPKILEDEKIVFPNDPMVTQIWVTKNSRNSSEKQEGIFLLHDIFKISRSKIKKILVELYPWDNWSIDFENVIKETTERKKFLKVFNQYDVGHRREVLPTGQYQWERVAVKYERFFCLIQL